MCPIFTFLYLNGFHSVKFHQGEVQAILRKVALHLLKKQCKITEVLNVYIFSILLQSLLMFHLWIIVALVHWKELVLRANPPQLMDS